MIEFPKQLYSLPNDAFKDLLGIVLDEDYKMQYGSQSSTAGRSCNKRIIGGKNIIDNDFAPNNTHLLVKKSLDDGLRTESSNTSILHETQSHCPGWVGILAFLSFR